MNVLATLWKDPEALKSNFTDIKSCLKDTIKWFNDLQKLIFEIPVYLLCVYLLLNTPEKNKWKLKSFKNMNSILIVLKE